MDTRQQMWINGFVIKEGSLLWLLNKVGEFAFDVSKQNRQGNLPEEERSPILAYKRKRKPVESKEEGSLFLT